MPSLVIIPTFNERDNLPILVRQIMAYPDLHVMVADDNSPDGTGQIADALAREFEGRIEVLHRTGPRGLGRSYLEAISRAVGGEWTAICQMDADLSHDPQYLPAMLAAIVLAAAREQLESLMTWVGMRRGADAPLVRDALENLRDQALARPSVSKERSG